MNIYPSLADDNDDNNDYDILPFLDSLRRTLSYVRETYPDMAFVSFT